MKEIVVKNLSYRAGNNQILNDLSLTIPGDKFVGLMGPNGCGKSTLLKHLYRVLPIQQGEITFDGTPLAAIPLREAAQQIGVMGQFHAVNFDFTVWQIVMMGRTPYKKGFDDDTEEDAQLAMRPSERLECGTELNEALLRYPAVSSNVSCWLVCFANNRRT